MGGGLVVAALLSAVFLWINGDESHGPLYDSRYTASSIGFTVDVDVPFAWAYTLLSNHGRSTVQLREADLVDSSGIQVIRAFVAPGSAARKHPVTSPTFTLSTDLVPLDEARMLPGENLLLVLKLEVSQPGEFTARGVSVSYDAEDTTFDIEYPDWIRVCTPASETESCDSQHLPAQDPPVVAG